MDKLDLEALKSGLEYICKFDRSPEPGYGKAVRGEHPGAGKRWITPKEKAFGMLADLRKALPKGEAPEIPEYAKTHDALFSAIEAGITAVDNSDADIKTLSAGAAGYVMKAFPGIVLEAQGTARSQEAGREPDLPCRHCGEGSDKHWSGQYLCRYRQGETAYNPVSAPGTGTTEKGSREADR